MARHPNPNMRKRLQRHLCLTESWLIFFVAGIIMMNFPFIIIFNKPLSLRGFPLLFLYLYVGWFVSIVVIYIFSKATGNCEAEKKRRGDEH